MLFYSSESELHMRFQLSASLREHCQLHALSSQAQGCQTPSAFFLSGSAHHFLLAAFLRVLFSAFPSAPALALALLSLSFQVPLLLLGLAVFISQDLPPLSAQQVPYLLPLGLFSVHFLDCVLLDSFPSGPDKPFSFVMLSLQNYNGLGLVWRNCNLPYLYACVRGTIKAPHDLNSLKFQRAF